MFARGLVRWRLKAGGVRAGQYTRVPEYDAVLRAHCGLTVACLAGRGAEGPGREKAGSSDPAF